MWQQAWHRLRLLGVVGAAGATVIIGISAGKLVGCQDARLYAGIPEHR
jgi:hypothetical protein